MLNSIKTELAKVIADLTDFNAEAVESLIELPKNKDHGHLAFPVFRFSKELKKAPPAIAQEVVEALRKDQNEFIETCEAMGGFVNLSLKPKYVQEWLKSSILQHEGDVPVKQSSQPIRIVIDYSSPNVAKPLGIGHLRATVIGQALRNLALKRGHDVVGLNYLGDWGVQFGKLAWAYLNWGSEYDFNNKPFESLYDLYVRFHAEEETNEELSKKGAETFQRLEAGDPEIKKLWEEFIEITMKEHEKLYSLLGIKFDLVQGESFYNDKLEGAVKRLDAAGVLEKSEGADVVFLENMDAPCLIRKSDGSSLYATRDIASAIYRHEEMNGDELLYVVGADQSLHFNQVFGVLKKMGFDWADSCHHIAFGLYRFKDTKMSTRKGNVVFMADVISKAVELASQVIDEKNPDLEDKDAVSQQVGVGAIIFNDLVNDRVKNVEFDWDRVLDFEGDSGPYVQYSLVRCRSLKRKYGQTIAGEFNSSKTENAELNLMMTLLSYEDAICGAWRLYKPNILAQYLLKVCQEFGHFYHTCRVIGEDAELTANRMTLVQATEKVLADGLKVLGIPGPEQM